MGNDNSYWSEVEREKHQRRIKDALKRCRDAMVRAESIGVVLHLGDNDGALWGDAIAEADRLIPRGE